MKSEEIVGYLQKEAGRLFDPEIVSKFILLVS
jgi:response regulator RpfG family c-di-GMP phosphodiesterase